MLDMSGSLYRVRYFYLALLTVVCVPRAAVGQSSSAQTMPANAAAVIVGEHAGKEVGRWAGALDWQGQMPIQYVGEHAKNEWTWQPHKPAELHIQVHTDRPRGVTIQTWARDHGATRVLVVIFPMTGAPGGTSPQGAGGTSGGKKRADAAADVDTDPDPDAAADADAAAAAAAGTGRGARGTGSGRDPDGDPAGSSSSSNRGRAGGYSVGSTDPSWHDNHRAELTRDPGGRTPGDGGKRGGSAGGEPGGAGNTLGLGLFGGLLDAPEAVAPLVIPFEGDSSR